MLKDVLNQFVVGDPYGIDHLKAASGHLDLLISTNPFGCEIGNHKNKQKNKQDAKQLYKTVQA